MLTHLHLKLPMRDKTVTRNFYIQQLGFQDVGAEDYEGYLILQKDDVELHFFEHKTLNPKKNYGQVYIRTNDIETEYQALQQKENIIHPNGHLALKAWGQKEFSVLDPDSNLLTFGQKKD